MVERRQSSHDNASTCRLRVCVYIQSGDYLIGAPGSLDRRGSVHKNKVVRDVFADDSRWYDDPAVDAAPGQHAATLDDYLGVYGCHFSMK